MIHAALTAALLAACNPTAPAQEGLTATAPPGLVPIKGVRAKVGADVKDIEKLIQEKELFANVLASETPRHTVAVDDFLLQVTEVTNEQFAAYVEAADARPPYTWGGAAIEEARAAFFEEEKRKKDEAAAAGRTYRSTEKFDAEAAERWWAQNWKDAEWEVPKEIADHPVTWVDYADAEAYARWAGLRLMTEFEFQAAARGAADSPYPWGDAWDPKLAAGLSSGRVKTWPVGSFPATNGVYDLIGNVWEWTSSRFTSYPGYKPLKIKVERREVQAMAPFDADQRVAVGGDFHSDAIALRVTVRRNSDRAQRTDSLGFRCAASAKPGRDLAEIVATTVVSPRAFPDAEFALEVPTLLHRWTYDVPAGTGERKDAAAAKEPAAKAAASARPEGYAVIRKYDALLFVPAAELPAVNLQTLDSATAEAPLPIGILYTTVPIQEPALEPGGYFLAYRAAGKLEPPAEGEEAPAWHTTPGYDHNHPALFVLDAEGKPLLAFRGGPTGYDKLGTGAVTVEPFVPPAKVDKDAPPPTPLDTVRFKVGVQGTQNNRGFTFDLPLRVAPGTVDATWGSK